MMKLTGESKILLAILAVTIVIVGLAAVVMTKPAPTLSKNDLVPSTAHTKGNANAKTFLVEFSDFQCPACLAVKPTVDALLAKHPDDLLFVYRYFPLDIHQFSHQSAQAAEAAGKQGKFWEMYDTLFAHQNEFSETIFADMAKQMGLNEKQFAEDYKSDAAVKAVAADLQAGTSLGINATPTFFLNGQKLNLTSFGDLTSAVDDAIAKTK